MLISRTLPLITRLPLMVHQLTKPLREPCSLVAAGAAPPALVFNAHALPACARSLDLCFSQTTDCAQNPRVPRPSSAERPSLVSTRAAFSPAPLPLHQPHVSAPNRLLCPLYPSLVPLWPPCFSPLLLCPLVALLALSWRSPSFPLVFMVCNVKTVRTWEQQRGIEKRTGAQLASAGLKGQGMGAGLQQAVSSHVCYTAGHGEALGMDPGKQQNRVVARLCPSVASSLSLGVLLKPAGKGRLLAHRRHNVLQNRQRDIGAARNGATRGAGLQAVLGAGGRADSDAARGSRAPCFRERCRCSP